MPSRVTTDYELFDRGALLAAFVVVLLAFLCPVRHVLIGGPGFPPVVEAERLEVGFPFPWITITVPEDTIGVPGEKSNASNTVPIPASAASPFGWKLDIGNTAIGLGNVLLAAFLLLCSRLIIGPVLARWRAVPTSRGVLVMAASAFVLGLLLALRQPTWCRILLLALPLPLTALAICWNEPRARIASIYIAIGVFVVFFPLTTIADLGGEHHRIDLVADVGGGLALCVVVSLLAALMLFVRRKLFPPCAPVVDSEPDSPMPG